MRVVVAFFLAVVVLMGGCASTGNQTLKTETEISVGSKIVVGETSAAEIKSMFGSPFESSYTDGGLQIWKFRLDDMNADAVNFIPVVNLFGSSMSGKRKELVILFDDEDVVKRFNMSESDVQTKTGLFK
jgi:glycine betaine/choline ABC-type transport system substrate-binding protein